MGSLRSLQNYPVCVQYMNIIRILKSIEKIYDGITLEILVEPRIAGTSSSYRYIIDDDVDIMHNLPRNLDLHINGSLSARIKKVKAIQKRYELLLKKSRHALNKIKRYYNERNYKLKLVRRTKLKHEPEDPSAESEYLEYIPAIYLKLDTYSGTRSDFIDSENSMISTDYNFPDHNVSAQFKDDSLVESPQPRNTDEIREDDQTQRGSYDAEHRFPSTYELLQEVSHKARIELNRRKRQRDEFLVNDLLSSRINDI